MNKVFFIGIILLLVVGCNEETMTGNVGEQYLLKATVPKEAGTFDYIWKIAEQPQGSKLLLTDLQLSADESQAIFTPDKAGQYGIQVTVWHYNDKLGAHIFNYDISGTQPPVVTATQEFKDDWLGETVEKPVTAEEPLYESPTVVETVDPAVIEETVSEVPINETTSVIEETVQNYPVSETIPVVEENVENYPVAEAVESAVIESAPVYIATANYTIQVGAVPNSQNALQLVKKLVDAGYDAYAQEYRANGQLFYRIRIGQYGTKQEAKQAAILVESDQNLPTWVTKYSE